MSTKLVKVVDDYAQDKGMPSNIGLVLRGPYEHVIKLTETFESCELMYDLLIDGSVFKMVPAVYCSRVKK